MERIGCVWSTMPGRIMCYSLQKTTFQAGKAKRTYSKFGESHTYHPPTRAHRRRVCGCMCVAALIVVLFYGNYEVLRRHFNSCAPNVLIKTHAYMQPQVRGTLTAGNVISAVLERMMWIYLTSNSNSCARCSSMILFAQF